MRPKISDARYSLISTESALLRLPTTYDNQSHLNPIPIPSVRLIALIELNRSWIELSRPSMSFFILTILLTNKVYSSHQEKHFKWLQV